LARLSRLALELKVALENEGGLHRSHADPKSDDQDYESTATS
jgi:hypothetical protein